MTHQQKITIVVPCYNVENYLERCLNSLVNQTYGAIEIILVEDCSTDETKDIVKSFEKKYDNIQAIYNKKNGGLGHARNVGIDASNAEYITFIDSDDWVPHNYVEELYERLTTDNADIAICDIFLRYDDDRADQRILSYDKKPSAHGFINTSMAASSNNKLFKKKLFETIRYPENIVNEDIPVTLALLSMYKSTYVKNTYYNYYQRTGSIQNSNITNKRFDIFKAVALLKANLGKDLDKKLFQVVIWHQIIAIFIYVLPKARGLKHRKNLIEEFYKLTLEYKISIKQNRGFIEFQKKSKFNNIYATASVGSMERGHFLLSSVIMGLFHYYEESKLLKNAVLAILHPVLFFKKTIRVVRFSLRRKFVIKKNIVLDDLALLAKNQGKNKNVNPVTVVIPNYNYENYLIERIYSVLHQTHKIGEIIILDDCSTDNSIQLAKKIKKRIGNFVTIRLINNEKNQGTFRQWEKGFAEAKYELLWIAEADDYSDRSFLKTAITPMQKNENILMSYVNTGYINERGLVLGDVKNDIDYQKTGHWNKNYINKGTDEAKTYAYTNNTIANVSSVIFRKIPNINYKEIFSEARKYNQAGDWVFYVNYMLNGYIAYTSKTLNFYRIHGNNVSVTTKAQQHLQEILSIQDYLIKKLSLNNDQQKAMLRRIKFLKKAWEV